MSSEQSEMVRNHLLGFVVIIVRLAAAIVIGAVIAGALS
jgi:hypothetical protein